MNLYKIFLVFFVLSFTPPSFSLLAQCNPNWIEIPKNGIDEDCDGLDDLYLTLPPYIYLTQGQDFELYFYNTFLSKHPQDYRFEVVCSLPGATQGKKWVFTPQSSHVGQYAYTLRIKAPNGTLLASAQSTIRVSPSTYPANTGPKKLLLLGHSFFDQGFMPYYLYERLQNGTNPTTTFYGTKQSWTSPNVRYEGHGGQTWRWFYEAEASPLTFGTTNTFNMTQYFNETICQNCRPDWIVIYLDLNDFCGYTPLTGTTLQEIDDTISNHYTRYANKIISSIRQVAPNAKIGLCSAPPPNDRDSAFADRFGLGNVLNDKWRWQKVVSRLLYSHNARFANRESENIYIIPTQLDIDNFLEYPVDDPIHPSPPNGDLFAHSGYYEIAKTIYSWIKYVENEPSAQVWYRDADSDGFGNTDLAQSSPIQPQGFISAAGDCNDSDPAINPSAIEICNNNKDDNCNGIIDEDWTNPIALCKSSVQLQLSAFGTASLQPSDLNTGSNDNCGAVSLAITQTIFTCYDTGFHFVTLTATDQAGNTSTCSSAISVHDNIAPQLSPKNPITPVLLGVSGSATRAVQSLVTSSDPCLRTYAYSKNGIDYGEENTLYLNCLDASMLQPIQVWIKAIDLSGNVSNIVQISIEVKETVKPTIICKNHSTSLDEDGKTVVEVHQLFSSKNDNCGSTEFVGTTLWNFDCTDIGKQSVTLTITDPSGNTATCVSEISVLDLKAPSVLCKDEEIYLNADGEATVLTESLILNKADNCAVPTLSNVQTIVYTCAQLGQQKVQLTVVDQSGNTGNCQSTLTIIDSIDSDSDGINNCSDACPLDASLNQLVSFYVDWDGDGYGSTALGGQACLLPVGMSWNNTDCNDNLSSVHPMAYEYLDGIDNDCDGEVDEETISTFTASGIANLTIAPNPSSGEVLITTNSSGIIKTLHIFDTFGQSLSNLPWQKTSEGLRLSLESLPSGTYVLKIQTEDGKIAVGKVLKI